MNKREKYRVIAGILCYLALVSAASASANYDLSWNVIGGGGGGAASDGYAMNSTLAQTAIGRSNNSYHLSAGYWYGVVPVGVCYDYDTNMWVSPPPGGPWNIDSRVVCNNTELLLNGDLNILNTGDLSFNNVTLRMNSTYEGEYGIEVNGAFFINSKDGVPSHITTGDNATAYYTFHVHSGSTFEMRNSELDNCGYAWNLPNYNDAGLWINTNNTVIENNTISDNHYIGMLLYHSHNHTITNNRVYSNDWHGIHARSSDNNYISSNHVKSNGWGGISLSSSTNATITHNTVHHSTGNDGIRLSSSGYSRIINNTVYSNGWDGICLSSSPNTIITNNTAYSNSDDGIHLSSSGYCDITNNTAYSNGDNGIAIFSSPWSMVINNTAIMHTGMDDTGIYISSSDNTTVERNEATTNWRGMYLGHSSNCAVTDNDALSNTWYGVHLYYSPDNTLRENDAHSNIGEWDSTGIYLSHSARNALMENEMESNENGMILWESPNASILQNTAVNNSDYGISLQNSGYSSVTDNTAISDNWIGISLEGSHHVDITDNNATRNDNGISLLNSDHAWILNNTASNNSFKGISLSGSSNNHITADNIAEHNKYGMYLTASSTNNEIYDNSARHNNFGFSLLWSSNDNDVHDNNADSCIDYGAYLFRVDTNALAHNSLKDSESVGVYLERSNENHVANNTVVSAENYGIDLFESYGNLVELNDARYCGDIGIELSSSGNNTVVSNTADECGVGISTRFSDDNTLRNNSASSGNYGIYLMDSNVNTILDNTANSNNNTGIDLSLSEDNELAGNDVRTNMNYGIHLSSSDRNDLMENTVDQNGVGVYLDWSGDNEIGNNTITNNDLTGIAAYWTSDDNRIVNNTVNSNGNISIRISSSDNNTIAGNTASDSSIGIFLDWSEDNTIRDNNVSRNQYHGITLEWFSNNNSIEDNLAVDNIVGISLQWSSNNTIAHNNASSNNVSVNLEWSSSNNEIRDNILSNNSYNGISLRWECSDNQIIANTVNNSRIGLYFDANSTGNSVHSNTFCGNSIYDIDDDDSNTGDDNICDLTDNWNDMGTVGCSYVCVAYDHIRIVPGGPRAMIAGETQEFTAYACDAADNIIRTVNVNWSVVGDIGAVNPARGTSTIFEAINASTGYVHADDGKGHTDDVEITVVEALIPDVTACDANGTAKNFFRVSDDVYCYGYALAANRSVDIYVVDDGNWSADDVIPGDVSGGLETVTTDANGTVPLTMIWQATIPVGQYDIIVDVDQDGYVDWNEPIDDNLEVGFSAVPTVTSTDAYGTEKNAYSSGEDVYVKASELLSDTNYTIWIQPDPVLEGETLNVSADPSGSQEVVKTDSGGNVANMLIWSNVPAGLLEEVHYDIVIDRAGDGEGAYNAVQDGLDDSEAWGFIAPAKNRDLVITENRVCWPDNCTICYNVTNIGNKTVTKGHHTALYVDDLAVAYDSVPVNLTHNESYIGCFDTYTWNYTPPADNITVCADSTNTVKELSETNNCLTTVWICGDVNGNEDVDMSDVIDLLYYAGYPGQYTIWSEWSADVNGDKQIDMTDVRALLHYVGYPGQYELNCGCR